MSQHYDVIVIGRGLFGAAASRYLSEQAKVLVVGPGEPSEATHEGVYSSHYDQGRITRQVASDPIWSELASRSIAVYDDLEERSGVDFHYGVGCLFVADDPHLDYLHKLFTQIEKRKLPHVGFDSGAGLQEHLPFLHFPDEVMAVLEPAPAGYINPRDLLRAQTIVAQQQGAEVVGETVVEVQAGSGGVTVTTKEGNRLNADKVLIAAGAFANCFNLLPRKLELRVKTETTLLAKVSETEADRLQTVPAVIFELDVPGLDSFYLLPPIRYPDGHCYVKLGCNTTQDETLADLAAMQDWIKTGNSDASKETIRRQLLSVIPSLNAESFETRRCLVTYTAHGKPYIDRIDESIYIVTGGNGSGAKSSDAVGKFAAELVQRGQLAAGDAEFFRAVYKQGLLA